MPIDKQLTETLQARIYDDAARLQLTIQDLRQLIIAYEQGAVSMVDDLAYQIAERWMSDEGKRALMFLADSLKTLYNSIQDAPYIAKLANINKQPEE